MATDAKSGKLGKITVGASDLAHVRNWRANFTSNNKKYASSGTSGHEATTKGAFGGSVSFDLVLDHTDRFEERLKVGDLATLQCYTDGTNYYSIPVRISSVDNETQVEEGEPPTIAVEADCHGAWDYPDGTTSAG